MKKLAFFFLATLLLMQGVSACAPSCRCSPSMAGMAEGRRCGCCTQTDSCPKCSLKKAARTQVWPFPLRNQNACALAATSLYAGVPQFGFCFADEIVQPAYHSPPRNSRAPPLS